MSEPATAPESSECEFSEVGTLPASVHGSSGDFCLTHQSYQCALRLAMFDAMGVGRGIS